MSDPGYYAKPLNPVEVENLIYEISNEIARGVEIVTQREKPIWMQNANTTRLKHTPY